MQCNDWGQPIGDPVPGWVARAQPDRPTLDGRYCRLELLDDQRHAEELFAADRSDPDGRSYTYLPYGPFADLAAYRGWLTGTASGRDPLFYAVIDTDPGADSSASGHAVGVLSLMRIQPEAGSIEVGHVHYSPLLQRRRGATEAQYLSMRYVFDDLGYRRYEWKCDALNAASCAAAERLGFRYEGTFRQAQVVNGRNRDTAWFSIIETEWPGVAARLRSWLAPKNFDDHGHQLTQLDAGTKSR